MKKIVYLLFLIPFFTVQPATAQKNEGLTYRGSDLQTLRIPAGGVGTGNILLGGRGNIEYLEVFNRPNRQRRLEKTFFSLWIKEKDQTAHTTLLERELFPPYLNADHKYAGGLPRMTEAILTNNYPHLRWQFEDKSVPAEISLEVINSVIPLDYESSNYPVCKFNWTIENPADNILEGSIALSMENPIQAQQIINQFINEGIFEGIQFTAEGEDVPVNYQGELLMGTTASEVEVQTHWYPGTWRDETHIFWDDFSDDGRIDEKKDKWITTYKPTSYNESTKRMATVLVPFKLNPREKISIPFYLSWYFPIRKFTSAEVFGIDDAQQKIFTNTYRKRFNSATDVLSKFITEEHEIESKAKAFAQILSHSSVPAYVTEALSTQISTLVSPLIQVTGDGDVHGFEGVLNTGWCCPGTCTHVWNYEQTLASLFPSLERKMREIEFLHNTFEDGFQAHRSVIPVGQYWFNGPAAADGQMGTIVRAYREWKLSGDNEWLARLWPGIKKALEFAWYGSGEPSKEKTGNTQEAWDENKTGLLSKRQHNTYDIDFYGPNSMTSSLYLAALKAGSEMAAAMGEDEKSKEYLSVYNKGSQSLIDSLWNGNYFIQIILDDPGIYSEDKLSPPDDSGRRLPKYQYGNGCLADQLLGQYLAFVSGLGYIADQEHVDKALMAIYENNFIENLRDFPNVQRVYGLNDEAGVVLCTWPEDDRPVLPFVYAEELWTGVEFQVAASLIYSGKVKEGLRIVEAIQDRYDGHKRNPFEHDESGVHYARALSSWSVLLALSGAEYNGINRELRFAPKLNASGFRSFWSSNDAWGEITINEQEARITVIHGDLSIRKLSIRKPGTSSLKTWNYPKDNTIEEGETIILSFDE